MNDTTPPLDERVARLEVSLAGFHEFTVSVQAKLSAIDEKLATRERTNWPVLLSCFGLIVTIAGGAFFVVKQEIGSKIAPIDARSQVSEIDRQKLNSTVAINSDKVSLVDQKVMVHDAANRATLTGVETQDRAIAQFANLRAAHNQQILGLLWEKVYQQRLPEVNYWPDVSLPKPHGQ